jgi:transposase
VIFLLLPGGFRKGALLCSCDDHGVVDLFPIFDTTIDMTRPLFDKGDPVPPSPADIAARTTGGNPRLRVPQRDQVEVHWASLDELLEPDHAARIVWAAVCELDLHRWRDAIKAVEGAAGRDATDPRLLVSLWIYATLEAVGSARELARLCEKHLAFQWLCGGVTVNYHLLADFRSQGGDKWDELLTQIVGSLLAKNLVTMKRVAQDGMRVRASAGKSSFRRRPSLQQSLQEAREQVEALKKLTDESPEDSTRRQRAARQRAAEERKQRVAAAIRNCEELQQQREETAKKSGRAAGEARASTSDPESRNMKFPDGGCRPGYNVQFSTDTESGIIVGVDVSNHGTDSDELPPMLEQLQERYDRQPEEALVDGGFASCDTINKATKRGCVVYAPLKEEEKQLAAGKDPYSAKKGDSEAVAAWRERMGTAAAKLIYHWRCQTAEWVNALCRNRGLWQMPVRGRPKCRTVAVLYAIAHNITRGVKLRAEVTMESG